MNLYSNRQSRKKHSSMMTMVVILLMSSSCANNSSESSTTSHIAFEPAEPMTITSSETASDNPEDAIGDISFHVGEKPYAIDSVSNYLDQIDTEYLDNESAYIGTEAILAYDDFIPAEIERLKSEQEGSSEIRMSLGLVDEDDVPELFLGYGDTTPCGILLYTYDAARHKVIPLGEFSQFGFCYYTEQKNSVWSQYGNQGFYRLYFSEISNNTVKLIGTLLDDDTVFYAGFSAPDGETGEKSSITYYGAPGDDYIVNEDEFWKVFDQYQRSDGKNGARVLEVNYSYMTGIQLGSE